MGKKPAQKSAETAKKTTTVKAKAKKPATEKKVVVAKQASPGEDCQIKGCKREYRAKGYCRVHYKKWRRGEYGLARYKTCNANDCRKPMILNKHGYCEEHFQSYYVRGESKPVQAAEAKPADKTAAA